MNASIACPYCTASVDLQVAGRDEHDRAFRCATCGLDTYDALAAAVSLHQALSRAGVSHRDAYATLAAFEAVGVATSVARSALDLASSWTDEAGEWLPQPLDDPGDHALDDDGLREDLRARCAALSGWRWIGSRYAARAVPARFGLIDGGRDA